MLRTIQFTEMVVTVAVVDVLTVRYCAIMLSLYYNYK